MAKNNANIPGESEVRRAVPEFDFYKLDRIGRIIIETFDSSSVERPIIDVQIKARHIADVPIFVTLTLHDVRCLRLPRIENGAPPSLSELEIHDISDRGLEGIKLHVQDYGAGGLACDCLSAKFTEVTQIDPNGEEIALWRTANE